MREALSAFLEYVWQLEGERGVKKVTVDVDPRNEACIGLLEGTGFRETGRKERSWRVGGVWCDSVYLAIRRPEADKGVVKPEGKMERPEHGGGG